jgi:hypothetical protein
MVGIGVVTKWDPEQLERKLEIEAMLRDTRHLVGLDLEKAALELAKTYNVVPYEITKSRNTLVNGGTNIILTALITGGTTLYNNANAALGVGDSATAFALGQTNLQGAVVTTDRIRKAMNATFPSIAANVASFQSTFATGEANFVWNEWAIFNAVADATGTMLNRAVANLGTKTSAAAWQLTVTLTQT